MKYYDRAGKLISQRQARELGARESYRVVLQTTTPLGYWVSTVWLGGIDHGFGMLSSGSPPIIFESMVQAQSSGDWVDQRRYATEAEARVGHAALMERWSSPVRDAVARLSGENDT